MIVTPVAKQPMALRNSEGFEVIRIVETLLLATSLTIVRGAAGKDVAATAYITTLCRCIIRFNRDLDLNYGRRIFAPRSADLTRSSPAADSER